MTKTLALVGMLVFSQACSATDFSVLGGAYVDTLNKFNVKAGFILRDAHDYIPESTQHSDPFTYADFEVGIEGTKITVGNGDFYEGGFSRAGLSYAQLRTQDLAGFELVTSQLIAADMALSVKLGYYFGLRGTDNRLLLGLGFGF